MVVWTRLRQFSALAAGTGAGLAAYYYQRLREPQNTVQALWTNTDIPLSPCALWDTNWDCRDPKALVRPLKNDSIEEQNRYNTDLEKRRPTAVRHIILVRHGEYLDEGDKDETHHLTELGRLQAKYTGQRLREMGMQWDKIFVSTMTRAQETAAIVIKELECDPKCIRHCGMLREGAPIPPQPPVGHWRPEKYQFFVDGPRIEAAFRRYFHRADPKQNEDSYTLLVGHGNVIRYFVCRALQLPPEAWLRITINHGSITWLSISPTGNVAIKYLGDSGYMPAKHLTNRIPRHGKSYI